MRSPGRPRGRSCRRQRLKRAPMRSGNWALQPAQRGCGRRRSATSGRPRRSATLCLRGGCPIRRSGQRCRGASSQKTPSRQALALVSGAHAAASRVSARRCVPTPTCWAVLLTRVHAPGRAGRPRSAGDLRQPAPHGLLAPRGRQCEALSEPRSGFAELPRAWGRKAETRTARPPVRGLATRGQLAACGRSCGAPKAAETEAPIRSLGRRAATFQGCPLRAPAPQASRRAKSSSLPSHRLLPLATERCQTRRCWRPQNPARCHLTLRTGPLVRPRSSVRRASWVGPGRRASWPRTGLVQFAAGCVRLGRPERRAPAAPGACLQTTPLVGATRGGLRLLGQSVG